MNLLSHILTTHFILTACMALTVHMGSFATVYAETTADRAPNFIQAEPKTMILEEPIADPDFNKGEALSPREELQQDEKVFSMQEYRTNYFIMGKPDTKVQFSFLFKTLRNYDLYFGYTQVMFWDLGKKDSNPFSDINYNPELFYKFKYNYPIFFDEMNVGYAHTSNGKDETLSRSMEEFFVELVSIKELPFGVPELRLRLRYIWGEDKYNKDLKDFYGPVVLKLYFTSLGKRLFYSEQFYVEYYNGGSAADDFSKSSVRVSVRFKPFRADSAPKIYAQYFNGYGENLMNYNLRDESFRIGLSIGGE